MPRNRKVGFTSTVKRFHDLSNLAKFFCKKNLANISKLWRQKNRAFSPAHSICALALKLTEICWYNKFRELIYIFFIPRLPLESFFTEVWCSSPAKSRTIFFLCANQVRKFSAKSSINSQITNPFFSPV